MIIEQTDVAIDCARILTKSAVELEETDLADYALEALKKSTVKRVQVVGRRGRPRPPLQGAAGAHSPRRRDRVYRRE